MIKFKLNGIDVQCDSAKEAQEILMGSLKVQKKSAPKTTSVDLKVTQPRARRSPTKMNHWTTDEVKWMFENRHQPTAYAQNYGELRKRHTAKAISIMMHKLRTKNLKGISKELTAYIPSLYAGQSTPVRRSLLDPIS